MIKSVITHTIVLGILIFLPLSASALSVGVGDYSGTRSTLSGGLTGFGGWDGIDDNGFRLAWEITDNGANFTYRYTISGVDGDRLSKALSHAIVQVSGGAAASDFTGIPSGNDDGLATYGPAQGNSNPGIPGDIFGIKWDTTGDPTIWNVTFTTWRSPVWGDFYAKDGRDGDNWTYVYNSGFGTDPQKGGPFEAWVARPNGANSVSEPEILLLLGTGLIGIAGVARRRKK